MLKLQDIDVDICGVQVLRSLNFALPSNKLLALIGPNGAGKTTTMRAIMGLIDVKGGEILFDDENLRHLPAHRRVRLGIGYLPEDRRLIHRLTVEENILLPSWAFGIPDAAARLSRIYEMIPEVGNFRDRRALQLSGGQQKLVAFARAILVGRKLLVLDEPFEGVAPALVMRLTAILSELKRDGDRTILVTDSSLGHAESLYDGIAAIERGRISE